MERAEEHEDVRAMRLAAGHILSTDQIESAIAECVQRKTDSKQQGLYEHRLTEAKKQEAVEEAEAQSMASVGRRRLQKGSSAVGVCAASAAGLATPTPAKKPRKQSPGGGSVVVAGSPCDEDIPTVISNSAQPKVAGADTTVVQAATNCGIDLEAILRGTSQSQKRRRLRERHEALLQPPETTKKKDEAKIIGAALCAGKVCDEFSDRFTVLSMDDQCFK